MPFTLLRTAGPHFSATSFVYDTLVWRDAERAIPWLALGWSWNEDRTVLTVRLRPGITWHDGRPLTARDVRFTFTYLKSRPELTINAFWLSYLERVEAKDPQTAVFFLRRPILDFVEQVLGWERIVPEHVWSKVENPLTYQGPDRFVGSGPFRVREYRPGEYYFYEALPRHFGGKPRVAQLLLRPVTNPVLALRQGEVDAASLPPSLAGEFAGRAGFALSEPVADYPYYVLIFNATRPPTADPLFRRALAQGIDRTALVAQALRGDGLLASPGQLHPEAPYFAPNLPHLPHDPERALETLARLGYRRQGERLLDPQGRPAELPLLCRGQENLRVCQLVQQDLARLGFRTEVRVLETGPVQELLDRGEFILNLNFHGGTFQFRSQADFPAALYRDPRYAELYRRWVEAPSAAQALRAAAELQRFLALELPKLPLAHPMVQAVYREREGIRLFWTKGGLGGRGGPPSFYNKLAFLDRQAAREP